jgi:hypothetical protein
MLILIILFAGINIIATYYFREKGKDLPESNFEKAGDYFALLGGIYGLLLGFVVVLSWGSYNDTQTNASKEESLALSLYREIRYFPDSGKSAPLKSAYIAFVHSVIDKEYPLMEEMKPFTPAIHASFSDVYRQMEKLNAIDSEADKMVEHLDQLAMYRSLRELGAYSEIPMAIWIPLLLGYLILITSSLFMNMTSVRLHVLFNGMLGAFVGMIIYIILLVNHPFAGSMKIEPKQYNVILEMEKLKDN